MAKAQAQRHQGRSSAWLDDLNGPIAVLETALGDVAREVREAQVASDKRNRALAANDDSFSRIAGATAALLRVVSEDALAARVRPSSRRPGQVANEEEAPPAGAGTGGTAGGG